MAIPAELLAGGLWQQGPQGPAWARAARGTRLVDGIAPVDNR